jgi:hypothetical protein
LVYEDESNKSKGYYIQSGRRLSKTSTFGGFTKNSVNKVGYARKKKTQKTKETQYVDADEHPFHSNEISYSRIVLDYKYDFYLKDRDIRERQTKLR